VPKRGGLRCWVTIPIYRRITEQVTEAGAQIYTLVTSLEIV